jgi:xylose isomerase
MLGSIDANTGVPHLGWDTDCFMSDTQQVRSEGGREGRRE